MRPSANAGCGTETRIAPDSSSWTWLFINLPGRNSAGILGLAFAPPEGLRIRCRARAQQRIVRWRYPIRQHQRIERDVADWAGVLALNGVDRYGSHVDLLPVRRPGGSRL